jgi:hypothetical protein
MIVHATLFQLPFDGIVMYRFQKRIALRDVHLYILCAVPGETSLKNAKRGYVLISRQ